MANYSGLDDAFHALASPLRDLLDAQLGAPVDVAAACGLGRRSPQVACALMDRMAALCVDPVGAAAVTPRPSVAV